MLLFVKKKNNQLINLENDLLCGTHNNKRQIINK